MGPEVRVPAAEVVEGADKVKELALEATVPELAERKDKARDVIDEVTSKDDAVRSVVIGMHKALPESISKNHSMNESAAGTESGRQVYAMLLKLQNDDHKNVYVLASHSHYFMDGTFNTEYWKANGGVLPGWIVGTAGAERYPLPENAHDAKAAKTNVYGYLVATVNPEGEPPGTIKFKFEELKESDIPKDVVQRFTPKFVHECFVGNRKKVAIE